MSETCISRTALMKLAFILLFPLAATSVSGSTTAADVGFRGIVELDGTHLFSLSTEEERAWVAVGCLRRI